eukprot:scaffold45786_cov50-Phaeocystis_antarctica.AAC.2
MPPVPAPSECESIFFSLSAQASEGSSLRYESSMASSSRSLMVPDPSTSAIWKSATTHSWNSPDQTRPSNEEHGVDGLGGGGDGGGGDGDGGDGGGSGWQSS